MAIETTGESVYVTANGLRHHVLRFGEPESPDLVILPGITSPALAAEFIAIEFAKLGYRVTVPDTRGRGNSDIAPTGQYRLIDYAADVSGIVDSLELENPVVVGHSMGARIAAAYSVLHSRPEHELLVLVDPPVSGPGRGPYPTPRETLLKQLHEAQRGISANDVRPYFPRWPERELEIRAAVLSTCDETAVRESRDGFESEDFFSYWQQLDQPVLLVVGEESAVVTPSGLDDLKLARPDIDVVVVPNAGHMVPWDNLQGFLTAVRPRLS